MFFPLRSRSFRDHKKTDLMSQNCYSKRTNSFRYALRSFFATNAMVTEPEVSQPHLSSVSQFTTPHALLYSRNSLISPAASQEIVESK
jgi:hypothetical protein